MKNWKKSALQGMAAILLATGAVPFASTSAMAAEVKSVDVRQGRLVRPDLSAHDFPLHVLSKRAHTAAVEHLLISHLHQHLPGRR